MEIEILKVEKAHKTVLRQLLELYCYDFSEYLQTDVNEHGKFEYTYLDSYWIDSDRYPYFIKVDGKYAGFVLVNQDFLILKEMDGHAVAEFFVMRRYRDKGVGRYAAKAIFDLHPGPWEISQVMVNKASLTFWEKVVEEYTNGNFQKAFAEKKGLKRQILIINDTSPQYPP